MAIDGKQLTAASVADAKLTEDYINSDGTRAMTADLPMGSFKITGLSNGVASTDAITKGQLDGAISGISWVEPVVVKELVGQASIVTINGLTPTVGDAYIATDAGTPTAGTSDALVAGSIAEYDGTSWIEIVAGSGGFVPDGTRAVLSTQTALILPYTEATDDGKIYEFDGTDLVGATTGEAVDGSAVLISAPSGVNGFFEDQGYTFNGTVPTGVWNQFTGVGQINAGAGLNKSGNTLFVGDINRGIQANADDLELDGSEVASSGLEQDVTNSWQIRIASTAAGSGLNGGSGTPLAVQPNVTDGSGVPGLEVAANGVRIASSAAGDGITGGGGVALSVQPNVTDGGGVAGLETALNGVRIATTAAGSGLSGGGGLALAVQPNTTDGGGVAGLEAAANGVRIASSAAGNGLTGGAGAALAVQANGGSVSVTASGVQAAVPSSSDKNLAPSATSGDGQSTGITITSTPAGDGYVLIQVNGIQEALGDGVKTAPFYFSSDGGATAKSIINIASADTLYWNDTQGGYSLAISDRIDLNYNVIV